MARSFPGVRAFIFDFDGTLYNSSGIALRLIAQRPLEAFILLAERKAHASLAGCDYGEAEAYYQEFFSLLSRRLHKPVRVLRSWYFDEYMPRMCRVLKKLFRLRPGCVELFEELARSKQFAVYSDYPQTTERLKALGLNLDTHLLFGPENFGAQKPAPRPFLAIAESLGVPPEEILVIGDRDDTDGAGAAAAGMGFVKVTTDGEWKTFCAALCNKKD
ncbi:hypothetical protein FACS189442_3410 [Spirochaetia bacterium]|nr:hypothetical protein FACS189442_3410 [Spirochaetia bacterium]